MKIGAVFCIYNEPEYIEYAVKSVIPAADKVFIVLGKAPYTAYNPKARELSKADSETEKIVDRLAKEYPGKIQITKGIWDNELDERDTGLQMCLDAGMDYFWLVDGDEVYRADHIEKIRADKRRFYQEHRDPVREREVRAANAGKHAEYIRTPRYREWKSAYDSRQRAAEYGEYAGTYLVLLDVEREVRGLITHDDLSRFYGRSARGAHKRKRDNEREKAEDTRKQSGRR